jgi:uncharacterized protein (TIGR00251 family)
MSDALNPIVQAEGGIRLAVRVTPRAKKSVIAGTIVAADGKAVLSVRLAAPPVDGAANKALVDFLATMIGVPRSAVRIVSGDTSRLKMISVTGVTFEAASRRLETGSA